MRPPRIRRLSAAEVVLWRAVADTVDLRQPGSHLPAAAPQPLPMPPEDVSPVVHPPVAVPPPPEARRPGAPPLADLDRRTKQKIQRGHMGIERRIDLHGMTQADAYGALRGFLRRAHAEDLRLVLVVTGKGERSRLRADGFGEFGVLRRVVPHWLRELDLRTIVLAFEPAGAAHGGGGALYIRLRRRKAIG
ncbi:Smr/MutS family protein [Lichenihabitans sp. Uapishka_5]|uniref:Smr/MutS family protein n=1 Tax=Lichenihabitans sp. Uapishka_5 TaxID=3037302 RepID=UPI0029E7CF75|nr:Smr/MutS family protein [Lichenihabitans sp. Uapishka_5]MDX7951441.1 Smr/MutS family protein [Lichenihabitans sp. Uapishka_5]